MEKITSLYGLPAKKIKQFTIFGVSINSIFCKSKSGSNPEIIHHPYFYAFSDYGKAGWSFALKEKYQNNKALLLNDIKKELNKARTYRVIKAVIIGAAIGAPLGIFFGYYWSHYVNKSSFDELAHIL